MLIPNIRQIFYLIVSEYRAVLARVMGPNPAVAAFAYTAGHIFFHRKIYLAVFKTHIQEFKCRELHHYRRAADYGYGVIYIYSLFF